MAKNKGDNNTNDMRATGTTGDMSEMTQNQNKATNKKGSTNKNKNSGAQNSK